MQRDIVIGYDGSDPSRDALALGLALVQATGGRLTIVDAYYDLPGLPSPLPGQMRAEAEKELREITSAIPADVALSRRLTAHRSPARALYEIAEETDADLIVIGSTRDAPDGHAAGGRLAHQLLGAAPCAVAIAPAGLRHRDARPACIAVGVDSGEEAVHALAAAADLARHFEADLLLMAAAEPIGTTIAQYGAEAERLTRQSMRAGADRALAAARELAPGELSVQQVRLEDGSVAEMLAEHAAGADVDLLVVGSRGFGPVRRALLGSVSSALMRDLPCGLVVVPRGARAPARSSPPAGEALGLR